MVLGARLVLSRVIREPERRYTVNKAFSLATTLIVVLGLIFIFADQFSSLVTLLGIAKAGLAIALQEIVASFAAWFSIRGNRGYTTRDWVQIGNDFGEVVDITFLRTTLQQFQPLSTDGKPSGANPTGGLIVLMNNAIFKNSLVNYTRGYPYVWCSLTYNFPFESNWDRAREILQEAMLAEREIVAVARRAKKNIAEMTSSFHIQVPSTEPVVRSWVSGVGVELTMRFLAHPRSRPELLDSVNLRVLRAIQQTDDIRFAYWTVRSISTPTKENDDALTSRALENTELKTSLSTPVVQPNEDRKAA
jgi:small-conductance mechanosensitive channel